MNASYRWIGFTDRLHDLSGRLVPLMGEPLECLRPGQDLDIAAHLLFVEEKLCREAVDNAAKLLSTGTGLRSVPEDPVPYFLICRCQCAVDFLGQVFPPQSLRSPFGEVPSGWSDAEMMEWLLVDLWRRKHDSWLKIVLTMQHLGWELYGLLPVDPEAGE